MTQLRNEIRQLTRYGATGIVVNLLLYLVFIILLRSGFTPTVAAGLCYGLGVIVSYQINRRWTFASTESHSRDLSKFLLAYGIGLASTLLTIAILMRWLPPEIAQVFNIGLTALVIYASLRVLRFGGGEGKHAN